MGFWDRFVPQQSVEASVVPSTRITAQVAPAVFDAPYGQLYGSYGLGGWNNYANSINRLQAMSVPSVANCRNLIATTIAGIPLEIYDLTTGEEIPSPVWLKQPDKRSPLSNTIAWTVDSLIFYGVAYWRVTEVYADDGRPARFEWIQNDRVTVKLDQWNQNVEYYMINNEKLPMDGVGSLITFQSLDQGLLLRAARTIKSAIDLELAVNVATQTPQPSGYIKNNGADLPDDKVQGLLNTWRTARQNRATAYLTQTLDYVATQFSPKDMTYNESAQYLATQIARAMNVPTYMIDAEQLKSSTYQNIIDARKDFLTYTLYPYIEVIQSRLSMDDLTPRTQQVRFAIDDTYLKSDAMERLNVIEKMLALGLIDVNQAKEMEDLTPDGDGEVEQTPNI
jgi:HK97 family phage portal protein